MYLRLHCPCEGLGRVLYKRAANSETCVTDVIATKEATLLGEITQGKFPNGFIMLFLQGREDQYEIPRKHRML